MLLVAERGREREVFDVFHKWGLDAVEIGRVTEDGILRVLHHGELAAAIPAHAIAEEGPRYQGPIAAPDAKAAGIGARPAAVTAPAVPLAASGADLSGNFLRLLASPTIASKHWITEQYDSMVQTNTTFGPGAGDAAVLRLKESKGALAPATDAIGRDACGGGGGAERGLQRGASDCGYELFEFWEPGKAGSDVAVQRGD